MLSTDGNPEQGAEVSVWAVTTFARAGDGELWLTGAGYTGHSVLRPAMNADEVLSGWKKHE